MKADVCCMQQYEDSYSEYKDTSEQVNVVHVGDNQLLCTFLIIYKFV